MKPIRFVATIVIALAAGIGILSGAALGGHAGFGTPARAGDHGPVADGVATLPPLRFNSAGKSYGSMMGRETLEAAPDLVLVAGNSGRQGYVHKAALLPEAPRTPEQAAALTGKTLAAIEVPVYDESGKNVIDTFTIQAPSA